MTTWNVVGMPVPQGSLRTHMVGGKPIIRYTNREPLALWRDAVRDACPITEPTGGGWGVIVRFRVKRPEGHYGKDRTILPRFARATPCIRPDLDKLVRAILDALTMRVWFDDGQVIRVDASKEYADTPGCTIAVYPQMAAMTVNGTYFGVKEGTK